MAETRRQNKVLSKGLKLPVTIEDAIEDALIVCLDYGARKYRGILLDTNKRNLPHGVCSKLRETNENNGKEENHVETPATYFRHTYNANSEQPKDNIAVKNVQKDKNTRQHIRLRPRQMFCSKCKATCQETEKGIVPITAVAKQDTKPNNTTNNKPNSSLSKEGMKKRNNLQNIKKDNNNSTKSIKVEKSVEKGQSANAKVSPFIKINIGAGTVLKIPPRFHSDEVDGISNKGDNSSLHSKPETISDDSSQRKTKKLKTKDREKLLENENTSTIHTVDELEVSDTVSEIFHHKKHKHKHKRKHEDETTSKSSYDDDSIEKFDENSDSLHSCDTSQTIMSQRPRLLYTWRQNKGLSPRRDIDNTFNIKMSPQQSLRPIDFKPRKEYRLRSREKSIEEANDCNSSDNSQASESEDNAIMSTESADENNGDSLNSSIGNDDSKSSLDDDEDEADGPPGDENIEVLRPLMMKIQTKEVTQCLKTDGRTVHVGDIVWGKIKGFPWWPGRVLSINVSMREGGTVLRQLAHLAWFGSSTMSHIQCSDLYPFLEDFKLKYNKKKRGPYKMAIKQATIAAQSLTNTHHIDFTEYDL